MARARVIKPGFFTNEDLAALNPYGRLLFIGLWTIADREGRLEDRPARIKAEIFPYDTRVKIDELLAELTELSFILRYSVGERSFICIPSFLKHQRPHSREAASEIPPPQQVQNEGERHDLGDAKVVPSPEKAMPSPTVYGNGSPRTVRDPVAGLAAGCGPPAAAAAAEPLRECFDLWTAATGTTVTRQMGDGIESWLERAPPGWVQDAIRETGDSGARSWKYTSAILERWMRDGRDTDGGPANGRNRVPGDGRGTGGAGRAQSRHGTGGPRLVDENGRPTRSLLEALGEPAPGDGVPPG